MEQANTNNDDNKLLNDVSTQPHNINTKGEDLNTAWRQESDPDVIVKSFCSPLPQVTKTKTMYVETFGDALEPFSDYDDNEMLIRKMLELNINISHSLVRKEHLRQKNEKRYKKLSQVTESCPKPGETLYKWIILEKETLNAHDKRKVCRFNVTAFDKCIEEENKKIQEVKKKNASENIESYLNSSSIIRIFPDQLETLKKEEGIEKQISHIIQALNILPMPVHVSPVLCLLFKDRMNQCLTSFDIIRLLLMVKKIIMSSKGVISEKKKVFYNMQSELAGNTVSEWYNEQLDKLALKFEERLYDKFSLHALPMDDVITEGNKNTIHTNTLNELYRQFILIMERYTISLINIFELFIIQSIIFDSNNSDAIAVPLNIAEWPTAMNILNVNDKTIYVHFLTQYNSFFTMTDEGGYYDHSMFGDPTLYTYMKTLDTTLNKQQIFCVKQFLKVVTYAYDIRNGKDFRAVLPDWLQTSVGMSNEVDNAITAGDNDLLIEEYRETLMNLSKMLCTVESSKTWKNIDTVRNLGDYTKYLAGTVVLYFFRFLTLEHPKWLKNPTANQQVERK